MNPINSALFDIFHNKNEFCCLCFKRIAAEEKEATRFRDEVVFESENCHNTELFYNILSCVLSPEFLKSVPKSELLCIECTRSATNGYTFIQTCKRNVMNLNNAIDSLAMSIEDTVENIHDYKSLFLSIDTGERISQQYYDTSSSRTLTAALEKFNYLSRPKATLSNTKPKQSKTKSDNSTQALPNKKTSCVSTKRKRRMLNLKNETYSLMWTVDGCVRYQCKLCFQVYLDFKDLEDHKCINYEAQVPEPVVSLNSDSSALVCSHCGKTCKSTFSLKVHELSHIRKLVCPNSKCKRIYRDLSKYLQHIENNTCRKDGKDYRSPKIFQCVTCKDMYATKLSLKNHIRRAHDTAQNLECNGCGKKFPCKSALQNHIVTHTKEKKFNCEQCGGAFVSRESLLYHTRLHTGEKPYECKFCDEKFLSASRRMSHVRRQHLEPSYECDLCLKKFISNYILKRHKTKHFNPNSRLYTKQGQP